MTKFIQQFLLLASSLGCATIVFRGNESKANVIFILADDLGYGDIEGRFSIRQGYGKLLLQNLGSENEQFCQLKEDRSETTNLARNYPDKVKKPDPWLDEQVADGRSIPVTSQKNVTSIDLWKGSGK